MSSSRQIRNPMADRWIALFLVLMFIAFPSLMISKTAYANGEDVKITIRPEKMVFNYSENIYLIVEIYNNGTKHIDREGYSYTIQIIEKNGKRAYHLFCYYNASMGIIPPNGRFEDKINIFEYSFDEKHPGKHLNHLPQGTYLIEAVYGDKSNPWYDSKYIPYGEAESNSIEITIVSNSSQSPPANLIATLSDSNVTLTWDPPQDDGNATITEYRIYRGTSPDSLELIASVNGSVTEYLDVNVTKGETYYYSVSAVNSIGESNLSDVVSVEIPKEETQPQPTPSLSFAWIIGAIGLILLLNGKRKLRRT